MLGVTCMKRLQIEVILKDASRSFVLFHSQDDVDSRIGPHRFAQFAHFKTECYLLEWLLHHSTAETAQAATVLRGTAVAVLRSKFLKRCLFRCYQATVLWSDQNTCYCYTCYCYTSYCYTCYCYTCCCYTCYWSFLKTQFRLLHARA